MQVFISDPLSIHIIQISRCCAKTASIIRVAKTYIYSTSKHINIPPTCTTMSLQKGKQYLSFEDRTSSHVYSRTNGSQSIKNRKPYLLIATAISAFCLMNLLPQTEQLSGALVMGNNVTILATVINNPPIILVLHF